MEYLQGTSYLQFHPDTLLVVRKEFGFEKSEDMNKAIDILDDWVKQQEHFMKKDFDREYLERVIINGKGSLERAKKQLDKMCTVKTLMPKYFGDFDIRNDLKDIYCGLYFITLPKLTKEHHRVVLFTPAENEYESTLVMHGNIYTFMLSEVAKRYDYASKYILILDYTRVKDVGKFVKKMNFDDLHKLIYILKDGYAFRISGVHFVTKSSVINVIMSFSKQVVSAKIIGRIYSHKSMETVYDYVPKNIFPKDYGGDETKTLSEIYENTIDVLQSEEFRKYRLEMYKARTDESRRQTTTFNEQYMGMPGTFRTLTVD